ncbi:MAG: hypothetical protein ABEJ00_00960, partial [Gemmatimonadota bacterium]
MAGGSARPDADAPSPEDPDSESGRLPGGQGFPDPGGSRDRDPQEHALRSLEFGRVLELIADRATSEVGAERVRQLRPYGRPEAAREALETADEIAAFVMGEDAWAPPPIPDVRPALGRLDVRTVCRVRRRRGDGLGLVDGLVDVDVLESGDECLDARLVDV